MDLLIDLGANINCEDNKKKTALHFAVNSGSLKCVKKLLIRGANKLIKNNLIKENKIDDLQKENFDLQKNIVFLFDFIFYKKNHNYRHCR